MTYQIPQNLAHVIRNDQGLYEGNLVYYAQVIFHNGQNLEHPYHNFRHMFHVLWLCYGACEFYRTVLSSRSMRDLLIAALFHDFNHSGMLGDDDLNIERAIRGLRKHVAEMDRPYLGGIEALVHGTQYPYVVPSAKLDLCGQILRDADVSQAFSVAWIQQVIFGLAAEWGKNPIDVLRLQEPFLKSLTYNTNWAREEFPQVAIDAKIREVRDLLQLLETPE